jgi:hypothetical protein
MPDALFALLAQVRFDDTAPLHTATLIGAAGVWCAVVAMVVLTFLHYFAAGLGRAMRVALWCVGGGSLGVSALLVWCVVRAPGWGL